MKWPRVFCALSFSVLACGAQAAATFSCSLGAPPNFTQVYSTVANASTALSVTVTCDKSGKGGGTTINYTVAPNNGLNPSGSQNRALGSGQYINYDFYTDSSCSIPWSGAGTITFPGGGGATLSQTLNYYGCVPASQPSLPAAGTSTDTVSMTLTIPDPAVTITGPNPQSFAVAVTVVPTCTIATVPGTVNFGTYAAFQGSPKTASTTFSAMCTSLTPYTLSLNSTAGVVSGLNYSLLLGTAASGGSHPLGPFSGTGSPQTYYINGTMPANQAGDCAIAVCAGASTHTLTITY